MICFTEVELEGLYKTAKKDELEKEIADGGYEPVEMMLDPVKPHQIVDTVAKRGLANKEDVEIFAVLFSYLEFYPEGSKICFVLKDSFDPRKTPITTYKGLKAALKEYELTDFAIYSPDGLRQFQLKRFRNELTTENFLAFIQEKVAHYGNDMSGTNLLVLIQASEGSDIGVVDFDALHESLKKSGFKTEDHILVSYNEMNEVNVINTVYPTLGTTRIPRKFPFDD